MGKPVVFFDIGCKDKEQSIEFYSKLFDWNIGSARPHSSSVDTESDVGISGAITSLGHEPHNYVMIYVEVDDIPAHLEKAESMGGQTLVPATDVPDEGQFAWLADPEGNMIGLWCPAR